MEFCPFPLFMRNIQKTRVKIFDLLWFVIRIFLHLSFVWLYVKAIFSRGVNILTSCNMLIEIIQISMPSIVIAIDMSNRSRFMLKRLDRFDKVVCLSYNFDFIENFELKISFLLQ